MISLNITVSIKCVVIQLFNYHQWLCIVCDENIVIWLSCGGTKEDIAADEGIFYEGSSSVSPDFLPTRAIIA